MLFSKSATATPNSQSPSSDFSYLSPDALYFDTACQSLRPQIVIDSLTDYYQNFNACGGRVKYAWGQQVDQKVADTRTKVLKLLQLSSKDYAVSFTLNTTYGLNLLLAQLSTNTYQRVITTNIEHNSVFLPTITLAERLQISRLILDRQVDGGVDLANVDLTKAIVVLNTVSNIDARHLANLNQLIDAVHQAGGIIIIDAAQAMAHSYAMLQKTKADAICFSAHKMYAASLGVVVAQKSLLRQLQTNFIGGGMVADVSSDAFQLLLEEPESILEPGLQAWAEIISLNAALDWLQTKDSSQPTTLARPIFDFLQAKSQSSNLKLLNRQVSPVLSFYTDKIDAHRLATFLSHQNIMARSGYFCAHYYLKQQQNLPPLLRLSLGHHNTPAQVEKLIQTLDKYV